MLAKILISYWSVIVEDLAEGYQVDIALGCLLIIAETQGVSRIMQSYVQSKSQIPANLQDATSN